jgi:inosine/xanthosine triphosphatase
MKNIIVASTNPVKIAAAHLGFQAMFPHFVFSVKGISVASGVHAQPTSNEETLRGAMNRAEGAYKSRPDADYWVGIEGGIEDKGYSIEAFAWVVVLADQQKMFVGKGKTGSFLLPRRVAHLIRREGMELGEADDIVFGKTNSKQDSGAVGLLTEGAITRTELYKAAVVFALIPFKNPELYF